MIPNPNLDKVMFQYAIDRVRRKVQDGTLMTDERIDLLDKAPPKCPYDPGRIQVKFDLALEFQVVRPFGFARS
jgi:hypothetical protein